MVRRGGIGGAVLGLIGIVFVGALIAGGCAYSGYQRVIGLDERVKADWAQVETVLQRRYDLIPNLVATVKGYAAHEEKVFTEIAHSRERYFSAATPAEKAEAASGVERALSRLLVLQEKYPELKAQQGFLDLQAQLEGTENRIATERRRYNESVQELNTYIRGLFGQWFAKWANVKPAQYFEVPEKAKEVPAVDFTKP